MRLKKVGTDTISFYRSASPKQRCSHAQAPRFTCPLFTAQSLCYVLEAPGLHIRAMNTNGIPMTDYLANTLSKLKHEYFGDIRPAGEGTVIRLVAE